MVEWIAKHKWDVWKRFAAVPLPVAITAKLRRYYQLARQDAGDFHRRRWRSRSEDLFLLQIVHHHLHNAVDGLVYLLRIGVEGFAEAGPDEFPVGG